jgi:hypothetical protein
MSKTVYLFHGWGKSLIPLPRSLISTMAQNDPSPHFAMPLTAIQARLLILDNPKPWNPTPVVTQLALMIAADQYPSIRRSLTAFCRLRTTHNTRGRPVSICVQEWIMERGKEIIAEKHAFASCLMNLSGHPYISVAKSEEEPYITFRIRAPPWPFPSLGTEIDL